MNRTREQPNELKHVPAGVCVIAQKRHLDDIDMLNPQILLVPAEPSEAIALDQISSCSIAVVEIDPSIPSSLKRLETLQKEVPGLAIIAGLERIDIRTSRELMRRGVDDLIALPLATDDLLSALSDLASRLTDDRTSRTTLAPCIAVMKAAGGCGATTLVTHLADALADELGDEARACIIDCDLQSGDAAAYLGCNTYLSLSDLVDSHSQVDADSLRSVANKATPRVDVIPAPRDIIPIESLDFDRLMEVVQLARQQYSVVVIDLPATITNWALSLIFGVTRVVQIGTLEIANLRHAKRQLDFLKSMGLESQRIDVILNRVEKRLFKTINESDAAEALNHQILATVHLEGTVLGQAQDEGVLIHDVQRRSRFSKDITAAAQALIEQFEKDS